LDSVNSGKTSTPSPSLTKRRRGSGSHPAHPGAPGAVGAVRRRANSAARCRELAPVRQPAADLPVPDIAWVRARAPALDPLRAPGAWSAV